MEGDEIEALRNRVKLLEERVRGLRTSRRILMNLLAAQEREKRAAIRQLELENRRLQRRAARLAQALLERNMRILRLEELIRKQEDEIC